MNENASSALNRLPGTQRTQARYYDYLDADTVACHLCPHTCAIAPSRNGACGVRTNRDGILFADTYGRVSKCDLVDGLALPLFHYMPGGRWIMLSTVGCTMRCPFCNTFRFSQIGGARTTPLSPAEAVSRATEVGAVGIAFGVNEPAVSHEYVVDVFKAAREAGLSTALQTSCMWNVDPIREAALVTDALVLGLKGFDPHFTVSECGGTLDFIRSAFEAVAAMGVHVEVSYLLVEDSPGVWEQLNDFASWIEEIDPRTPVHLLPLVPEFTWKRGGTSPEAMERAHGELSQRLVNVYRHGSPNAGDLDTRCNHCRRTLVRRGKEFGIVVADAPGGDCPGCHNPVPYKDQP